MLYDLIIIGGGPAGITAGIYAARKRLKTLLLTKDFLGQVSKTSRVDNWPGTPGVVGMDLIKGFEKHLRSFAAVSEVSPQILSEARPQILQIMEGQIVSNVSEARPQIFAVSTKQGKKFFGRTIIAATGRVSRQLGAPGEEKFEGRGVSFCSICDGPFFKDKKVAVIGGGNSGFETALDLTEYAQKVSILEKSNKITADEALQEKVKKDKKITVSLNKELQEIKGENKVEAIVFNDLKSKKVFHQPVDGVFISIGMKPVSSYLQGLVKINQQGEVKVSPGACQTSLKGIFAAGDINDLPYNQIATAVSDGCRAALAAYEYLASMSF